MSETVYTAHAKFKMRYYGLSESRVKRVIRNPERIEEGIAPDTVALMQTNKTSKKPYEIWVMLLKPLSSKKTKIGKKVISAWKYPGKTKPGEPLPPEMIREIREIS